MPLPVGIDLGTVNSVVSVYRRGRAETLRVDGASTMPSVVCFKDANTTLVGSKALQMAMIRPEQTILSVKRHMGNPKWSCSANSKTYSAVDISAMILRKLCSGHEATLGGPPTDVVITVPAYFTDEQRKDTIAAGELAGLNVLRLLPEPTSAAIAIGLDKGRDQTILVYDLGGGTFDVSILRVEKNKFTVQAVNGNHDLGGNDFDVALRDYALEQFAKTTGIALRKEDSRDPLVRQALQVLTTACERVKTELSEAEDAYLDLPNFFRGQHLESKISRRIFEGLIKQFIYDTKDLVLKTISEAKLDVDDIDRLVLVGGSTKIPLVARVLADTVKEPYIADNVDLAVSHGAAIMAANLYVPDEFVGSEADYSPVEIDVTDVVAHPISVAMNDGNRLACTTIIAKNSPLPATGMTLGAASPYQREGILPIFRGGNNDPSGNQYLGELCLTFDSSSEPTFLRFEMTLDVNGVLQVEGATIDLDGQSPERLLWVDPQMLKVRRRIRAEIRLMQ